MYAVKDKYIISNILLDLHIKMLSSGKELRNIGVSCFDIHRYKLQTKFRKGIKKYTKTKT